MTTNNPTDKINRITSTTLQKKSGKTWQEWFAILNKAGAKRMMHQTIAEYLVTQHDVDPWWSQMITVGYEQFHGLREKHQKHNGYEISVSKTINVPVAVIYQAWEDKKLRQKWLAEPVTIRKATPNKSMRITWSDNTTSLSIEFYTKDKNKSRVVVQHSKIANAKSAENKKIYWKALLQKLNDVAIKIKIF